MLVQLTENLQNLAQAKQFSGLVAVTKCIWGKMVKFRLLARPKTRKSRFVPLLGSVLDHIQSTLDILTLHILTILHLASFTVAE